MGGSVFSVSAASLLQGENNASDRGAKPIAFQTISLRTLRRDALPNSCQSADGTPKASS